MAMTDQVRAQLKSIIERLAVQFPHFIINNRSDGVEAALTDICNFLAEHSGGLDFQESVINATEVAPPAAPADGARYCIAGIGGAWASFTINDIVEWDGTRWMNIEPTEGMVFWNEATNILYIYNGAAWVTYGSVLDHGTLAGLADDDHTHYLLASGTRNLTGNLAVTAGVTIDGVDISAITLANMPAVAAGNIDCNTQAITNVGLVDGIDISAITLSNMPAAAAGNIDCNTQAITNVGNVDGIDISAITLANMPAVAAGNIDCNTQAITNVGNVDGVDISAISLANMPAAAAADIGCGGQSITNVNLVDGVDISAATGRFRLMNMVGNVTTADDRNVAGLASAIALAIDLRASIVVHMMSVGAGAHAVADPFAWAQLDTLATVAWVGANDGLVTVVDSTGFNVDDVIYLDNTPALGALPATGYIHTIDTTTPGAHIVHVTVAAGGLGGNVDFTGYTAALVAHLIRSINVLPIDPINLATLLAFTDVLRQGYVLHDDDAELGALWLYHIAQEAGDHSINPALPLTTLAEAIIVLNAFQTAYNAHVADVVCHTAAVGASVAAAAANGNACTIVDANALPGDIVSWAVLDGGAGPKAGVTAIAGTGIITVTMDAPPVGDTVISYSLGRAI